MGRETPLTCQVLEIGPGRLNEMGVFVECTVEIDQFVLIPPMGGMRYMLDGQEFILIQDNLILATLTDDEAASL